MRVLMTRKSCAVGMRNAILRNYLKVKKSIISTSKKTDEICSQMTMYYIKHINRDREIEASLPQRQKNTPLAIKRILFP